MVANPEPAIMTVEEYLALEETSQEKHEYVHGYVYAMSGGTLDHDAIGMCGSLSRRRRPRSHRGCEDR